MQRGRRIFYDKLTGNVILEKGERGESTGFFQETTVEEDFASYKVLAERVRETVGCLELEYGQYAQDFTSCNGYRIKPETGEIEFSYPDPNQPEKPPVYRKPLSEDC